MYRMKRSYFILLQCIGLSLSMSVMAMDSTETNTQQKALQGLFAELESDHTVFSTFVSNESLAQENAQLTSHTTISKLQKEHTSLKETGAQYKAQQLKTDRTVGNEVLRILSAPRKSTKKRPYDDREKAMNFVEKLKLPKSTSSSTRPDVSADDLGAAQGLLRLRSTSTSRSQKPPVTPTSGSFIAGIALPASIDFRITTGKRNSPGIPGNHVTQPTSTAYFNSFQPK